MYNSSTGEAEARGLWVIGYIVRPCLKTKHKNKPKKKKKSQPNKQRKNMGDSSCLTRFSILVILSHLLLYCNFI
jgi:hypothetical protein